MEKTDTTSANILARPGQAPKGIVDPAGAARRIRLATYPPCAALQPFVEYFWLVEWDLTGKPAQIQRILPYPNAHLAFDQGRTAVHGVGRGAFERVVEGAGRVLGVRFRPGALRPFIGVPMSRLTDRTMPASELLGVPDLETERLVLGQSDDQAMVAAATSLLTAVLPAPDPRALQAEQAVAAAAAEFGPVDVAGLCGKVGIEERALQRLFSNYVGVSPKWVIQRYRLQEATALLGKPGTVDLAELAGRLGFFDQAHFTRQFSALVGMSPLAYWKSQQP